jgi:transposase
LTLKKYLRRTCLYCGFITSYAHDGRLRKVRDLSILNKPLFLNIHIKRYRCLNYFNST